MSDVKQERKVERNLIVFDELPPAPVSARGGTGGRVSEFDTLLDRIHGDDNLWGRPVSMSQYENETGCKAAANVLRKRNGKTMAESGHEFVARKVTDMDGKAVWHLFVIYDPSKIVPGALEAHLTAEAEREAVLAAKRGEKNANGDVDPDM